MLVSNVSMFISIPTLSDVLCYGDRSVQEEEMQGRFRTCEPHFPTLRRYGVSAANESLSPNDNTFPTKSPPSQFNDRILSPRSLAPLFPAPTRQVHISRFQQTHPYGREHLPTDLASCTYPSTIINAKVRLGMEKITTSAVFPDICLCGRREDVVTWR
jgi:hypothetical protein